RIEVFGRLLEALVLLQTTDEVGSGILFLLLLRLRPRQQHPRLDLGERRGHYEVLADELELELFHQLDVLDVLPRTLRDRDVEDVEVLAPNQVEQKVERPFERF